MRAPGGRVDGARVMAGVGRMAHAEDAEGSGFGPFRPVEKWGADDHDRRRAGGHGVDRRGDGSIATGHEPQSERGGKRGGMSRHGRFIWNELLTSDPDAATAFYGAVFGWRFEDYPFSRIGRYRLAFVAGDPVPVAGMLEWPADEPGAGWFSYMEVDDLDDAVEAVAREGGRVSAPRTVEGVGDVAYATAPCGASFALVRRSSEVCPHRSQVVDAPAADCEAPTGRAVWNELSTHDIDRAQTFFAALAGWSFLEFPRARVARYFLATPKEGPPCAGLIEWPPGEDGAGWLVYFGAADIAATLAVATAAGGRVEPIEILPEIGRVSFVTDPAGTTVGLFEAEGAA